MFNFLKKQYYRGMAQDIIIERIALDYKFDYLLGLCDMAYDLGLIKKSEMEQFLDIARRNQEQAETE